jgi:hypothetical protein
LSTCCQNPLLEGPESWIEPFRGDMQKPPIWPHHSAVAEPPSGETEESLPLGRRNKVKSLAHRPPDESLSISQHEGQAIRADTSCRAQSREDRAVALRARCRSWIRKLQARFVAGGYASAVDAAARARRLLWTSAAMFETAEYHFYGALSSG